MEPMSVNDALSKAHYDCVLLASALTNIEKTVDININPRKMLINEIKKETYLWIQSICEAKFENHEGIVVLSLS